MKEDEFGLNSQLMWVRGDYGDRGAMQAMNFQGLGMSPWMQQPSSMLPEMYHAAALQDMRSSLDPSKPVPTASLLQFQQPPRQASLMQQSQQAFLQGDTPMTQHHHSFGHHQMPDQVSAGPVSPMSHFSSASQSQSPSSLQPISPMCQQQQQHHNHHSFQDSNGIASPLHGMMGSFPADDHHLLNLQRGGGGGGNMWPSKRAAVEPPLMSSVDHLGPPPPSSVSLPPFPGRECGIDQDGNGDPGSNLLFGVNIDPSSLLMQQNGMASLRGGGGERDPFPSSSYMNAPPGSDFSLNPAAMTTPSGCIDESEFLHSPDDDGGGQGNNPNRTFVKVSSLLSFLAFICVFILSLECGA